MNGIGLRRGGHRWVVLAVMSVGSFGCSPTELERFRYQPGIAVEAPSTLETTEAGGTVSFTVRLLGAPTADVHVQLASSNAQEGTLDAQELVFGKTDWSTPRTVTVTGVDDAVGDGDQSYEVSFTVTSEDAAYDGFAVPSLSLVNLEIPWVHCSELTPAFTTEDETESHFELWLGSPPEQNVVVTVTATNPAEVTITPATLTFSPSNWATPIQVTVAGVDDAEMDGDKRFQLVFEVTSTDADYDGFSVPPIFTANFDDEPVVVSVDSVGNAGDGGTPSLSADGRFVAFDSRASNLVPNDTNGKADVFLHDRLTGVTERVSVTSEGAELSLGVDNDYPSRISGDGNHVVFTTDSPELSPEGKNLVFVHHREDKSVQLASVFSDQPVEADSDADISNDGRYVAFTSYLVEGSLDTSILLRDMQATNAVLVSHYEDGSTNQNAAWAPRISGDARRIVYLSPDLAIGGGPSGYYPNAQIYVYDTATQRNAMLENDGGTPTLGYCQAPAVSSGTPYQVTFHLISSEAANDSNGSHDVYSLGSPVSDVPVALSVNASNATGNGHSWDADISDDGRYVAFWSEANDLVPNDTNGYADVFVVDRDTMAITNVSSSLPDAAGYPSLAPEGRFVAFTSGGEVLVAGVP